jgi:predicted  nucleic acid-binding Zn ribbon protein
MFVVELKFDALTRGNVPAKRLAVFMTMGALKYRGHLIGASYLTRKGKAWTLYGLAPAKDAFQKSKLGAQVQEKLAGLTHANVKLSSIRFLGELENTPVCRCKKNSGLVLVTSSLTPRPPLSCLRCGHPVPTYRLPMHGLGIWRSDLSSWAKSYKACEQLWIYQTSKGIGLRQLSDLKSELSQAGLKTCKEIAELTGRPVYYYLSSAIKSRSREVARPCPSCGGEWRLKKRILDEFDFKCDKCRLLSSFRSDPD